MNTLALLTSDQRACFTVLIIFGILLIALLAYGIGYFSCYEKMVRERQKEEKFDENIDRFCFYNAKPPNNYELN
jgi:hypothetical protein